jgi:hypothetical protein
MPRYLSSSYAREARIRHSKEVFEKNQKAFEDERARIANLEKAAIKQYSEALDVPLLNFSAKPLVIHSLTLCDYLSLTDVQKSEYKHQAKIIEADMFDFPLNEKILTIGENIPSKIKLLQKRNAQTIASLHYIHHDLIQQRADYLFTNYLKKIHFDTIIAVFKQNPYSNKLPSFFELSNFITLYDLIIDKSKNSYGIFDIDIFVELLKSPYSEFIVLYNQVKLGNLYRNHYDHSLEHYKKMLESTLRLDYRKLTKHNIHEFLDILQNQLTVTHAAQVILLFTF